ncbi:MAG TPA: GNAT family N-acetyltransferase [Candidatus Limnocylindrales bacterium]|nr:GNAT family N-acetyltransferase [Candidatus Limnocylindrales bacterium]
MSAESIRYRPALEADLGAMALVMERANAFRDGQPLPTCIENESVVDDLRTRMHKEGAWTNVAADHDRIAGFMSGYPYSEGENAPVDRTKEYLSLLMIEPDYWGRGIASRLLDIAASRARQAEKQQLLLWTRANENARARSVYEHKGYVATGRTRVSQHGYGLQVQYAVDL